MKKLKPLLTFNVIVLCVALLFAGHVYAYTIDPDVGDAVLLLTGADQEGWDTTAQPVINDILTGEGYDISNPYEFEFPSENSDETIDWTGMPLLTDATLLVKDGNHAPHWYFFSLEGWNGMDSLELTNFWTGQGAISHATVYGGAAPVPEPATMLLLGTGLVGLAGLGRKRLTKK